MASYSSSWQNDIRVWVDVTHSVSGRSVKVRSRMFVQTRGYRWFADSSMSAHNRINGSGGSMGPLYREYGSTSSQTTSTLILDNSRTFSIGSSGVGGSVSIDSRLTAGATGFFNRAASGSYSLPNIAPLAPSGLSVTRLSDGSHRLNWSRGSATTAAVIQRRTNSGSWQQIARPSGNVSQYTDNTTAANRRYDYRVAGVNVGGQSGWSNTATVYTTPAAPSGVSAVRVGDDIRVSASGLPPYATSYDVYDDGTLVGTSVSLPWTHAAPNPAVPHVYTVRSKRGSLVSGHSAPSNTVQLQAPPLAPTGLSPNGVDRAGDEDVRFSWVHSPVDSSEQTVYELRYRDASTWTTVAGTTDEHRDISLSVADYEWQVRTKGAHADWGPWSAVATVSVVDRPGVAVTFPDGDVEDPILTVEWSWLQGQGRPQSAWRVTLESAGVVLEARSGAGPQTTLQLQTRLVDGEDYVVTVEAATGDIWSAPAVASFSAVFDPPAPALFDAEWSEETGQVTINTQAGDPPVDVEPVTNLFTNPRLVGDGTWAEVARFTTGDEPPVMVQPEDFRIRDLGTGESVVEIEQVRGVTGTNCIAGVSTWEGRPAIRTIATTDFVGAWADFIYPSGNVRTSSTLIATAHLKEPLALPEPYNPPYIQVVSPLMRSDSIPNEAGDYPLRISPGQLTSNYRAMLLHMAAQGAGDVWWTDIGLFEGDYEGPSFHGGSGFVDFGDGYLHADWDGPPDNSTSTAVRPPETVAVSVERSIDGGDSWETILEPSEPLQTLIDTQSLSNGTTLYRVMSFTVADAATTQIIPLETVSEALWLSAGDNFQYTARLPFNPSVTIEGGRERSLRRYSGREKPVAYAGEHVSRSVKVSGMILDNEVENADVDALLTLFQDPNALFMFRDPDGRRIYGVVSDVSLPRQGASSSGGIWGYSFSLDEAEL